MSVNRIDKKVTLYVHTIDKLRRYVDGQICKLTAQAAEFTNLDDVNGSLIEEVIHMTAQYNSSMLITKSRILRNIYNNQPVMIDIANDLKDEILSEQFDVAYESCNLKQERCL
jgi:hypothetical protein